MGKENELSTDCAETAVPEGIAFIEAASPLTRLHYFDGKFLKADALSQEQQYHRTRVQLSNQAGGWGVVNGLGIDLSGNVLIVDGGLAITPAGNFVMNVGGVKADIAELIKVAETAPPEGNADFQPCVTDQQKAKGGSTAASGLQVYEITVGPIDTLCGNEPVYGKLCESACVSDSRHPYWREGMVLRLRPISLKLPSSATPLTTVHLRNRIASAYFALEPGSTSDLLSRAGLQGGGWCGTTSLYGRDEVAIGLLTRDGSSVNIDSWAARRERMDSQARSYWQGRMAMRPWNVFLAQVLQFQCQLSGLLQDDKVVISPADDCDSLRAALDKARKDIEQLHKKYASSAKQLAERFAGKVSKADAQWAIDEAKLSTSELSSLSDSLSGLEVGSGALPSNRLLLSSGFQQLPPAGYLPIEPGKTAIAEQLERIFGEGVRVHLRAARADVLPHLLEEAQHMDRISLTRGLDNPQDLEDVEVFIPDGQVRAVDAQAEGTWWQTTARIPLDNLLDFLEEDDADAEPVDIEVIRERFKRLSNYPEQDGLSRTEARADGSFGLATVVSLGLLEQAQTQEIKGGDEAVAVAEALSPEAAAKAMAEAIAKTNEAANKVIRNGGDTASTEQPQEAKTVAAKRIVVDKLNLASYFAGDLATDPFALAVGDDTSLKFELAILTELRSEPVARHIRATGTATVIRRVKESGQTLLILSLDLSATNVGVDAKGQRQSENFHAVVRIGLIRRGDGRTGLLRIDDYRFNENSAALDIEWDDAPQVASLSVVADIAQDIIGQMDIAQGVRKRYIKQGEDDALRLELVHLAALAAQPATSSATGASALNALTTLADALDDPALLARATARLFPVAKASRASVTAQHDWVMFRRLRPSFCCETVATPTAPTVEGFQVWHLKLRTLKELELIMQALKKGDDSVLLKFAPKRVGVLRYLEDSTEAQESPARVLAMWTQAQPGQKVVLARVWENTPEAGQGWQNHFRVRSMLEQISTLSQPPANGTGAIAALPKAPGPLAETTVDGGMLVVTLDDAQVTTVPHRVILVSARIAELIYANLLKTPVSGWLLLQSLIKGPSSTANLTVRDLIVHFDQGLLRAADAVNLDKALDEVIQAEKGNILGSYTLRGLRLDAAQLGADVQPQQQDEALLKHMDASGYGDGGQRVFQLTDTDLGGAQVVSVVFVDYFANA